MVKHNLWKQKMFIWDVSRCTKYNIRCDAVYFIFLRKTHARLERLKLGWNVDPIWVGLVDWQFSYSFKLRLSHDVIGHWGWTPSPKGSYSSDSYRHGGFPQVLLLGRGFPLISTVSKIHSIKFFYSLYPPTFLSSK